MANLPLKIRGAIFLALALLGLTVRLTQLGGRPMHTDEAVNAYIVGEVLGGKPYHYDPLDRHGPVLAEIAVRLVRWQGAKSFADLTETQLRLVPVLAGTVGILLFGAGVELFGFIPGLLGALLFAFAPLPLYYSRYFIHETLFVVGTYGLIVAGGRAFQKNSTGAAILAGGCAAFMLAAKETAVLHFAALAIAALLSQRWAAASPGGKMVFAKRVGLPALGTFVIAGILLFTWGGQNCQAPLDLIHAIPHLAARAEGEGHAKPFYYYLKLLVMGWSGAVLLMLGLIGFWRAFYPLKMGSSPLRRFLAIYAVLIAGIYSAIPYKTPWLALNLWLPWSILMGLAVEWLWSRRSNSGYRSALFFGFVIIAVLMAHDTRRWVFQAPADEKNPFAYAQTTEGIMELPVKIQQLCGQKNLQQPRIAVIAADAWPLPWYLRKFPLTGYWQPGQDPGKADFYITTSDLPADISRPYETMASEYFGIRPNLLLNLWWSPVPATSASPAAP